MIVVTVELQSAITGKTTLLGKAIIANVGGDENTGEYRATFGRRNQHDLRQINSSPTRQGEVKDFPRLRLNAWHLLRRALEAAGY